MIKTPSIERAGRRRARLAVSRLLYAQRERRSQPRRPYFGPVKIWQPDSPAASFSAFARDISELGIGLIHVRPIAEGNVIVTIPLPNESSVNLLTEIVWCRDYGDGWFSSGGRFLDVV
jgi:hypothetical protein